MKFATVAACPVFGGKVGQGRRTSREEGCGRAADRPLLDDMVAVVGDHMWRQEGLDALKIDWDEGPNAKIGSRHLGAFARGQ